MKEINNISNQDINNTEIKKEKKMEIKDIRDIKEFYSLEKPIITPIGNCHFVRVKDYDELIIFNGIIFLERKDLLNLFKKDFREEADKHSTIQIIKEVKDLGLHDMFKNLFEFIFEDDVFDLINTDEELYYYLKLIIKMNKLSCKKVNSNPELAYYDKMAEILKAKKGEIATFNSIITSVGLYKSDVLDLTIYSLYLYFDRISYFKGYSTTALFKTVSTEQMDLVPWYKDGEAKIAELDESDYGYINKQVKVVKDSSYKNGTIVNKL